MSYGVREHARLTCVCTLVIPTGQNRVGALRSEAARLGRLGLVQVARAQVTLGRLRVRVRVRVGSSLVRGRERAKS